MGDDFDEDDDDDFGLRKRSEIVVSQEDLVAKSLPVDGAFVLSPILAHSANQERIKAIIEDVDAADQDQGFVFEEVSLAPPRRTQAVEGGLEPLLEPQELEAGDPLGDTPDDFRVSNVKQLSETMIGAPPLTQSQTLEKQSSAAVNPQDSAVAKGNLDFMQPMRSSDQMRRRFMANLT